MKKAIYAAVAATIAAGSAVAHPVNEPHVCGIDPASVSEWPGYGTRDNIYDRGDYFFAVEVENFSPSISYKHWNKVEAITLHHRVNKETCAVSTVEIVHPESEPEIVESSVGEVFDDTYGLRDAEYDQYRLVYNPETRMFTAFFGHGDNIDSRTYPAGSNELGDGGWIETQYPSFHQATVDQEYWSGNSTTGTSNPIDFSDPAVNKERWDLSVERYNGGGK